MKPKLNADLRVLLKKLLLSYVSVGQLSEIGRSLVKIWEDFALRLPG